ncbi:MAG TPA: hypothetical protein D7H86_02355 [Candidatus Poseidoniales archaeon]|nr:MAG TPA: hypothetical protein D7H86_02355 [Candidatus Poseidoniales archaeon]
MALHLNEVQAMSQFSNQSVDSWITAPSIIQLALDEEANGEKVSDIDSWPSILDLTVDDDVTCTLSADDQLESAAAFASSSLLHKDLDISNICQYLEDGTGTGEPSASSTMWIVEINPDLSTEERQEIQRNLRDKLNELSSSSPLNYESASIDLISNDIDENAFDNLILLISIAIILVVALLYLAFRTVNRVLFPFIGLTYALIWTYGLMNLFGGRFTALEVAVAPLVLGLGIDYSIHLQRRFANYLESEEDTSKAWMATCGHLFAPLTLAVVTTIAAFLANLFSPLDPIKYFGLALAIGVISAFVSSTLIVGSLHVLFSKTSGNTPRTLELPRLSSWLSGLHREQQAAILLGTIIISGASIIGATGLETEFDLTDFLDEDMEIMQSRGMLEDSYESAGWKLIYVLMEPADGDSIPADKTLLAELRGLHSDFESNDQVVGTQSRTASPTYEGPYVVLRDAILRDASFGEKYGLEVYKGDGQVYVEGTLNLALVYADLGQNNSVADPLTGDTWADRVNHTVYMENNQIVYLRNEIMVDARTSADSNKVVDDFEIMLGTTDDAGKPRGVLANHAIIHLTGDLVQLDHVLTALNTSQLNSTAFSLFASLVVLFLLTRKIVPTLIVLLPVVIATLWVVGSMIILGLKWNVLTVMVTALSIGIGIDYTIHMWRRYERNKAEGMEKREALEDSIATTGVALIISSATTALGFIVLMLSKMPLIQDFGLITALTVISSLVLCLVVLPVLLSLSEKQLSSGDS